MEQDDETKDLEEDRSPTYIQWFLYLILIAIGCYIIWTYITIFRTGKWDLPHVFLPKIPLKPSFKKEIQRGTAKAILFVISMTAMMLIIMIILIHYENGYYQRKDKDTIVTSIIGCDNWNYVLFAVLIIFIIRLIWGIAWYFFQKKKISFLIKPIAYGSLGRSSRAGAALYDLFTYGTQIFVWYVMFFVRFKCICCETK